MRSIPVLLAVTLSSLAFAQAAASQPAPAPKQQARPDGSAHVEAMKKLAYLEGRWAGDGWMQTGPERKESFRQTEEVSFRAGGTVLAVTGIGSSGGRTVHDAFGVISYDPAKGYRMRAWLASGLNQEMELTLQEKGFQWGFKDPRGGQIRYTMSLTEAGEWLEIGERSTNGSTWMKFFEMRLTKAR